MNFLKTGVFASVFLLAGMELDAILKEKGRERFETICGGCLYGSYFWR